MRRSNSVVMRVVLVSVLAMTLMNGGCASSASSSRAAGPAGSSATALKSTASAQTAPVPNVQDCGIVAISSPPKYACGGKVYTATQLAKIRNDQATKYQSGR